MGVNGRFLGKVRDVEKIGSDYKMDKVRPHRRGPVKSIMRYVW